MNQSPFTRRSFLRASAGFGSLALSGLLQDRAYAEPSSPTKPPHFPARAKSVIFLYMDGGPSGMDTFDPKPRLDKEHGQPIKMKVEPTQFNNVGMVLKSPWKFKNRGQSGLPVSDLLPHIAGCADDLCVIRSMHADFSEHTNANYFLHTGTGQQGRPSIGSWVTYGLGSECQDLPGFIVLGSGLIPPGGRDNFNSGFLPANYQASLFQRGKIPVEDLKAQEKTPQEQKKKLNLINKLDQQSLARTGSSDALESAIRNYELAYKMQSAVPELFDLSKESAATKALYGVDEAPTDIYGRQCLIARRMVERGVRFIELLCPNVGHDRWDQHSNLVNGHAANALATDKPIAGLIKDLKARGLLSQTLLVWGGEFGRTPMAQGSDGRDHNPFGFTVWMAGGGTKGGYAHGATDEYGYHAIQDKVHMHDLHATILHLLGMEHTKLTYRFGGRDMRLTDIAGEVVQGIMA
ncbi:DUF1501 domain-containing protein [Telmatocola sphagniphila]|uniref:DUF1501 domain-containing protein n=1 Tax=Telmatocola sphagniphila TaxID=1123043 RepID=A0A8E6B577_9BACT|nr:DUF1501 domain-containing protein [Telmatocola sphagniphila]QVL32158.1 DUF1501 domain-containing protein [Telmatocola sphagniphila]